MDLNFRNFGLQVGILVRMVIMIISMLTVNLCLICQKKNIIVVDYTFSKEQIESLMKTFELDFSNYPELSKVILDQNAPTSAQRYFKKRLLQLSDFTKDEIDQILPPSFDEMRATEENAILEKDKLPEIDPQDDHYTHISIHNQVADNPSKIAHIQEHKKLLIEKREEQELKGRELPKELPPELPPELTKILGAQGSMGLPSELGAPEGVSPELGQQMPQEMPQEMPQI